MEGSSLFFHALSPGTEQNLNLEMQDILYFCGPCTPCTHPHPASTLFCKTSLGLSRQFPPAPGPIPGRLFALPQPSKLLYPGMCNLAFSLQPARCTVRDQQSPKEDARGQPRVRERDTAGATWLHQLQTLPKQAASIPRRGVWTEIQASWPSRGFQ